MASTELSPYAPVTSPATVSSTGDGYSANIRYIELQKELRFVLSAGVTSLAPSRAGSPLAERTEEFVRDEQPNHTTEARAAGRGLLSATTLPRTISKLSTIKYLKNWFTECAPELDKFDDTQQFGVNIPILASKSPALLYAVLAFSARQTERRSTQKSHDSLELYQESIRLLGPSCNRAIPMFLPRLFNVTGFSGGLLQAVFWCYARMELCGLIISNFIEATVLPLEQWAPSLPAESSPTLSHREQYHTFAKDLFRKHNSPDMHANFAVYLCTQACDLMRRQIFRVELGEVDTDDQRPFATQWQSLWTDLREWLETRPLELLPIQSPDSEDASSLFPRILFTHWAAISSNQLYHTACLILLDTETLGRPPLAIQEQQYSLIWHAKQICGISMTNPHLGNLVNAIQPLYLAGRHLSHLEEHLAVARLLKKIDRSTGWGALWRLRDLEAAWGYDAGEILLKV
ncbi:uncharacterized protein AB675_57 [Cyphellophora attinorum]|uniref:Transcription factor domain-containing protein n=1 Tax=Cyphellophora attinorum TaxID=1664694 RepID=A0A0N0NHH0_9EURO|nr:uncharacterized protein AB675_57 [Phialophora attinorum]KPI34681.1 hypothetical protein AB675_57 [Phialophora attinorum]